MRVWQVYLVLALSGCVLAATSGILFARGDHMDGTLAALLAAVFGFWACLYGIQGTDLTN